MTNPKSNYPFKYKQWGRCDYLPLWKVMQEFTAARHETTQDEIWLVEHNPIYTFGQRANAQDIIHNTEIPVIHTDRGGQITYHGPGQLVIYPLLNLKRLHCHLRMLVDALENTVIRLLADHEVKAYADPRKPGVYIEGAKVASLGLRIRKGCSLHGLAINIDMDLRPFQAIRPCGFQDIIMTQLVDWIGPTSLTQVIDEFLYRWYQQAFYHE